MRLPDWLPFLLAGATGFTIYNIALNHGEITVPAGIASFIVGLIPVFTMLLAITFLKERMSAGALFGVIVSFIGIILIAVGEHGGVKFDMGVVYNLVAALSEQQIDGLFLIMIIIIVDGVSQLMASCLLLYYKIREDVFDKNPLFH